MAYQGHLSAGQELQVEQRHEHPDNAEYVKIAIILAVITLAEVVIWYVEKVKDLLIPALIIMSIAKFLLVVGYFMHLKFDNHFFRYVFFFGLGVALVVFIAAGVLFEVHKVVTFFSDLTG